MAFSGTANETDAVMTASPSVDVSLCSDGVTPVLIAHENGNTEMEALLTAHGAKINVVTLLKRKLVHSVEEAYASGMK